VDKAAKASLRNGQLTLDYAVTGVAALPKEVENFMNLILMSYDPITETLPGFTDRRQLDKLAMPVLSSAVKRM
jgi:hypothetical protein